MATREQILEGALRDLRSVCFDRRNALFEFERCFWGEIKGRAVAESDETGTDYHLESTNA